MPLEVSMQLNIVLYSIMAGVITGMLYDFYKILRGISRVKIITAVEDILFWILAAMIVFTFLLYVNYAFMTMYVYIFMTVSLLIYLRFFSRYLYGIEEKIAVRTYKILRVVFKNIAYPVKILIYKGADKEKW